MDGPSLKCWWEKLNNCLAGLWTPDNIRTYPGECDPLVLFLASQRVTHTRMYVLWWCVAFPHQLAYVCLGCSKANPAQKKTGTTSTKNVLNVQSVAFSVWRVKFMWCLSFTSTACTVPASPCQIVPHFFLASLPSALQSPAYSTTVLQTIAQICE